MSCQKDKRQLLNVIENLLHFIEHCPEEMVKANPYAVAVHQAKRIFNEQKVTEKNEPTKN